ncbi:MAG: inorganic phosphate transporter [Bacteroidales bacterium]
MDPIFTVIVVILAALAILDLIVGVSNDAINFLNAAIGSKVAPLRVIMIIAAMGIIMGVLTSNGMMEVARNGIFNPGMFTFNEIMFLFLGVMMADVILLNTFNLLGLPTSTTVSLVFELLGSAVAVAIYKVANSAELGYTAIGTFINSDKALAIISGILMSVVIAFVVGTVLMYISRLIFTFRYAKQLRRYGAMWCAIAMVGILYFSVIKGLKGVIPAEFYEFMYANLGLSILVAWAGVSVILFLLQMLKVNIMKVTVLAGTFALALAFAGNDLVNFIGVPIAGIESYLGSNGDPNVLMTSLEGKAAVPLWILASAGAIMAITLFFSRNAMKVAATQINLSSQKDEDERFGSSLASRSLVRFAMNLNNSVTNVLPERFVQKVGNRFTPLPKEEQGDLPYDLIRAVVNLTAASILICIATSFKLPLSTTYVVFMVAMGTSLADRAWGRDSAVYRITGVMVVISGWFITALAGFVLAIVIASALIWGGWAGIIIVGSVCCYALAYNLFKKKSKKQEELELLDKPIIKDSTHAEDVLLSCTETVCDTMEEVTSIYNDMLIALFNEDRKTLKEMVTKSEYIYHQAHKRKYEIHTTLKEIQDQYIETAHFYVQIVDYMCEVSKALLHCVRPSYVHIMNNHTSLSEEQVMDLKEINDSVFSIVTRINDMVRQKDFTKIDDILVMRDELFNTIAVGIKKQLKRLKNEKASTKASTLYLNILSETKTMVLQSRNLLKSQAYFLNKMNELNNN